MNIFIDSAARGMRFRCWARNSISDSQAATKQNNVSPPLKQATRDT